MPNNGSDKKSTAEKKQSPVKPADKPDIAGQEKAGDGNGTRVRQRRGGKHQGPPKEAPKDKGKADQDQGEKAQGNGNGTRKRKNGEGSRAGGAANKDAGAPKTGKRQKISVEQKEKDSRPTNRVGGNLKKRPAKPPPPTSSSEEEEAPMRAPNRAQRRAAPAQPMRQAPTARGQRSRNMPYDTTALPPGIQFRRGQNITNPDDERTPRTLKRLDTVFPTDPSTVQFRNDAGYVWRPDGSTEYVKSVLPPPRDYQTNVKARQAYDQEMYTLSREAARYHRDNIRSQRVYVHDPDPNRHPTLRLTNQPRQREVESDPEFPASAPRPPKLIATTLSGVKADAGKDLLRSTRTMGAVSKTPMTTAKDKNANNEKAQLQKSAKLVKASAASSAMRTLTSATPSQSKAAQADARDQTQAAYRREAVRAGQGLSASSILQPTLEMTSHSNASNNPNANMAQESQVKEYTSLGRDTENYGTEEREAAREPNRKRKGNTAHVTAQEGGGLDETTPKRSVAIGDDIHLNTKTRGKLNFRQEQNTDLEPQNVTVAGPNKMLTAVKNSTFGIAVRKHGKPGTLSESTHAKAVTGNAVTPEPLAITQQGGADDTTTSNAMHDTLASALNTLSNAEQPEANPVAVKDAETLFEQSNQASLLSQGGEQRAIELVTGPMGSRPEYDESARTTAVLPSDQIVQREIVPYPVPENGGGDYDATLSVPVKFKTPTDIVVSRQDPTYDDAARASILTWGNAIMQMRSLREDYWAGIINAQEFAAQIGAIQELAQQVRLNAAGEPLSENYLSFVRSARRTIDMMNEIAGVTNPASYLTEAELVSLSVAVDPGNYNNETAPLIRERLNQIEAEVMRRYREAGRPPPSNNPIDGVEQISFTNTFNNEQIKALKNAETAKAAIRSNVPPQQPNEITNSDINAAQRQTFGQRGEGVDMPHKQRVGATQANALEPMEIEDDDLAPPMVYNPEAIAPQTSGANAGYNTGLFGQGKGIETEVQIHVPPPPRPELEGKMDVEFGGYAGQPPVLLPAPNQARVFDPREPDQLSTWITDQGVIISNEQQQAIIDDMMNRIANLEQSAQQPPNRLAPAAGGDGGDPPPPPPGTTTEPPEDYRSEEDENSGYIEDDYLHDPSAEEPNFENSEQKMEIIEKEMEAAKQKIYEMNNKISSLKAISSNTMDSLSENTERMEKDINRVANGLQNVVKHFETMASQQQIQEVNDNLVQLKMLVDQGRNGQDVQGNLEELGRDFLKLQERQSIINDQKNAELENLIKQVVGLSEEVGNLRRDTNAGRLTNSEALEQQAYILGQQIPEPQLSMTQTRQMETSTLETLAGEIIKNSKDGFDSVEQSLAMMDQNLTKLASFLNDDNISKIIHKTLNSAPSLHNLTSDIDGAGNQNYSMDTNRGESNIEQELLAAGENLINFGRTMTESGYPESGASLLGSIFSSISSDSESRSSMSTAPPSEMDMDESPSLASQAANKFSGYAETFNAYAAATGKARFNQILSSMQNNPGGGSNPTPPGGGGPNSGSGGSDPDAILKTMGPTITSVMEGLGAFFEVLTQAAKMQDLKYTYYIDGIRPDPFELAGEIKLTNLDRYIANDLGMSNDPELLALKGWPTGDDARTRVEGPIRSDKRMEYALDLNPIPKAIEQFDPYIYEAPSFTARYEIGDEQWPEISPPTLPKSGLTASKAPVVKDYLNFAASKVGAAKTGVPQAGAQLPLANDYTSSAYPQYPMSAAFKPTRRK